MAIINDSKSIPFSGEIVDKVIICNGDNCSIYFKGGKRIVAHLHENYTQEDYDLDNKKYLRNNNIENILKND